jgi:hypothetical protein
VAEHQDAVVSRLQKRKAKFNPYMVTCNFIGYFILSVTWPFSGSVSVGFCFCHVFPSSPLLNSPLMLRPI